MKKKVLIIGYGSAGKRHAQLLRKNKKISKIFILTKQKCDNFIKITNLYQIKNIRPDYIIISSETSKHYKHLNYFEKNFSNKIILVEKPLFNKYHNIIIKKNKVFIAYNLRFNPIISYLKKIKNKNIFFSGLFSCTSYLPDWRKKRDYKKTYSANKKLGGGALLDLSHELDYIIWIFGNLKLEFTRVKKISNLKINSDDNVQILGKVKNLNVLLNLNFFSKIIKRELILESPDFTIKANLIKNVLKIYNKKNDKVKIKKFKKINT